MAIGNEHDDGLGPELLLFDSGGSAFAVEAVSIDHIAGPEWQPAYEPQEEDGPPRTERVWMLARVLGLPAGEPTRTLVVDSGGTEFGFRIERIGGEYLGRFDIRTLPHLLAVWLKPLVVTGIAEMGEERRMVSVLDLRLMASLLLAREIEEAS